MDEAWNAFAETPMRKSIPILSEMSMKNRVITHMDQDGMYRIIIRPEFGVVVLFGPMLLSDRCWTLDNIWAGPGLESIQKLKCQHPAVRAELKKLQQTAERSKVPKENVILVDCSDGVCLEEVSLVVQDAFAQGMHFFVIEGHVLASLPNHVGVSLTKIFRENNWE
jgi:hypothetical protein